MRDIQSRCQLKCFIQARGAKKKKYNQINPVRHCAIFRRSLEGFDASLPYKSGWTQNIGLKSPILKLCARCLGTSRGVGGLACRDLFFNNTSQILHRIYTLAGWSFPSRTFINRYTCYIHAHAQINILKLGAFLRTLGALVMGQAWHY
jgi:hypothetical protein